MYLHHIFGPGKFVVGEGAEFRGQWKFPRLPEPYYSVVEGSQFASNESRLVNIHIISTLGVEPQNVQRWVTL